MLFGVKDSLCFGNDDHSVDQLKKENEWSVIRDFVSCINHSVREETPDV